MVPRNKNRVAARGRQDDKCRCLAYKPDIVEIEWIDAASESGWESIDYHESHVLQTCYSVGYLITAKRKDQVHIVQSVAPASEHATEAIVIPKAWVQSIRVISKGKRVRERE